MSFHPESGVDPPLARPGEPVHWLVRPRTVRGLRIGFGVVLAGLVLGDLVIHPHAGFGVDGTFGFHAWYGLGTCVAMVLFAKGLGLALKRPDTWYAEGDEIAPEGAETGTLHGGDGGGEGPAAPVESAADETRSERRSDD